MGETLGQLWRSRKLYPVFKKDTVMTLKNFTIITAALAIFGGIVFSTDLVHADGVPPANKLQRIGILPGAGVHELTPQAKERALRKAIRKCDREKCKHLDLRYLPVLDLSVLSDMTHLKTLYLSYTEVSDLSPIAELTQITDLHIGRTKVTDISPIAKFKNLSLLHLWGTGIEDFSVVSSFTELTELALSETAIKDLQVLKPLKNLQNLALENIEIYDISVLETLPELKFVQILNTDHFNQRSLKRLEGRGVMFGYLDVIC
jgi:hypothetical protein